MSQLTFELVTLEGVKFSETCHEVILPTTTGQIAVFPDHIPLVSVAAPGVISIRRNPNDSDDRMVHFASTEGVVEIKGKVVRVLADAADAAEDVNEMEAKEALERAKELVKRADTEVALADAQALIERQTARLRVADIKRRRRRR